MRLELVPGELAALTYWITAREGARLRKELGCPKPWTADPLLRDYRWCNVRRMDDRVSRELFSRWYTKTTDPIIGLAEAVLARLVNWPDSLVEARNSSLPYSEALQARYDRGDKTFTGAYIVPGVPGMKKSASVVITVAAVAAQSHRVIKSTMAATWAALVGFDRLGSFLAGQIVADLAHLPIGQHWPDTNTWAPLGPGSMRGLNRLCGRPKDARITQREFDMMLPQLIEVLRPRIDAIWTDRKLQAMDIQNCLCEFDKYRRLTFREGTVRARYPGTA